MEVICMEDKAFFALLNRAVDHIKVHLETKGDKWISGEEAMKRLHITSKTTLQKLRDEGKIRFTQPEKKIILYDADSITYFLESHSRNHIL
jgi:hypothetical protein